ncbi:MAG TPA: ornithine aminotransferase [Bacteroidales bacterium]|nr:MAG: ornithine aminotransferase [Bacteroidetes bacterium GWF2_35_48]OFY93536.1 MAG: ornithine aminotransferase [Bacteroidetes bacterium RIFOXYC12_FULL_35_7]HBX49652.1 ornithine aminotransferase [Bacteroidales bacterium]
MKTNEDLQKDVQDAIKWEPLLNAAEIGVIAKDGVVTLSGVVDSYMKKTEAETAAKNVAGVKAVVEKIEIRFDGMGKKDDSEVAKEILSAFKWAWSVPTDKVKVKVEDGWVTLEGELQWNYQRDAAKKSIQYLHGVRGVTNHITIKSEAKEAIQTLDIERALGRNWSINSKNIHVRVSDKTVTLSGTVHSSYQKDEAGRIAWNAPGVWIVNNELEIVYD